MDESNEVRRQIENSHPTLVELNIPGDYVPHDGDWERDGKSIGRNTHLKKLVLSNFDGGVAEEDFEKFLRGVACSRSIQKLCFLGRDFFGGEIFRILLPLFKRNQVDCLELDQCGSLGEDGDYDAMPPACSRSLATALELGEFDSLKEFELTSCYIDGNAMEQIIRALAGHSGLRKLNLAGNIVDIQRNACDALANLLQDPNSKLSVLDLKDSGIDDEGADALAPGLAVNNSLKGDLNLGHNRMITEMGWRSIFAVLQSPSCRLEKLSLACNDGINDAVAILLSNALGNNITVKSLNLSFCGDSITIAGWSALFGFLRGPNCALKELDLSHNRRFNINGFNNNVTIGGFDDNVTIISLSNALTNNRSLQTLNLSHNDGITTAEWQAFSAVLQSTNSGLEKLDLGNNMIMDEAVNSIANALVNNSRLRELDCQGNIMATATAWLALSAVLESPHSALEKLDLDYNSINNDTLASLANSLATNSKLKEMIFNLQDNNGGTFNGWGSLSHVLCNTSSIVDTYQSNHTLQKVSQDEDQLPQDLRSLLELNRENSKTQAARLKIIKTHFSGGFTAQPFVGMESNVLPHAIAWMGRDGRSNETTNHLYHFIMGMPLLFDMNSKNKKRGRED